MVLGAQVSPPARVPRNRDREAAHNIGVVNAIQLVVFDAGRRGLLRSQDHGLWLFSQVYAKLQK